MKNVFNIISQAEVLDKRQHAWHLLTIAFYGQRCSIYFTVLSLRRNITPTASVAPIKQNISIIHSQKKKYNH